VKGGQHPNAYDRPSTPRQWNYDGSRIDRLPKNLVDAAVGFAWATWGCRIFHYYIFLNSEAMPPLAATCFDHILTVGGSHPCSESRGSFAFTAGAAKCALRHSNGCRMRLVKGLSLKRPQFSSVQSYHLHPVVPRQF
jgi:hypothetical protein